MSSLARQLQQLQIPGSLPSAAAKTSKKASLLFDAKEAADIDNETIFSIALNGRYFLPQIALHLAFRIVE